MTVRETAELLKLNQQTVRNWIIAGTLPAVHVGRRVRIKRADLEALVEAGYSGRAVSEQSGIWDGEVPSPKVRG